MSKRKTIPPKTELKVLVKSRRRCCICYGLARDESVKKGQIAHLDRNPSNYDFDNLAYMCLEHHDEYDTRTSQSKGWSDEEARQYRNELYERFAVWGEEKKISHLLNFLAFTIDLDDMLDSALEAVGEVTYMREIVLEQVLSDDHYESCDGDLWMPYLYTLEYLESWGWLEFNAEEKEDDQQGLVIHIDINHKPICFQLLDLLKKRLSKKDKK